MRMLLRATISSATPVATVALAIGVLCTVVSLVGAFALLAAPVVLTYWFVQGVRRQPVGPDAPARRHAERMAAIDARHEATFGRTYSQAHYSDRR